jgi:rSAM/selenodomain-associated transferase 1
MDRIAVFARRPFEGRVKTRLSPALPPRLAVALYQGMLRDALDAAEACGADDRWLFWAEATGPNFAPRRWNENTQPEGDLGARLEHAFAALFAPRSRVVITGADCPLLDSAQLHAAFAALDRADVVIGPANDGGYTLIGLREPRPELFRGVDWGTDAVLSQTRARAELLGLRVETLASLDDLDTPGDLARLVARLAFAPGAIAPNTWRALSSMGLLPEPRPRRSMR